MPNKNVLPKGFTPPHLLSGLCKDAPILIGLSGGADSGALLYMLTLYSKESGAKIYAAHVNHGIRGAEADRDEEFCRKLCSELGVEFFSVKLDVPRIAEERGDSIETAARDLRYEFFDGLMAEHSIPILATAHNANDNLETVIFNLVRGSSLTGMCGIPQTRACRYGTVIRPILSMSKDEIYDFCHKNGLSYVTDSTNADTEYTRNMIRARIIPLLTEINSGAIKNASRLTASLRADSLCLESMKDMFLEGLCDENSVETEKINGSPDAISNRAIVELYKRVSDGSTLEYTHIDAVRKLCARSVPHSSIDLPAGIVAVIEDGRVIFEPRKEKTEYSDYVFPLTEGENRISQTNCEIIILYSQNAKIIYKNSILTSIDSAKIFGSVYARSRRGGDKILSGGMHKSVKKLMCEKKIPPELRQRLPVICDDKGILAIPAVAVRDGAKKADGDLKIVVRLN